MDSSVACIVTVSISSFIKFADRLVNTKCPTYIVSVSWLSYGSIHGYKRASELQL